ncbi:hypothetical protein TeGR_g874 [Tetraparma gracilis]|uniref:C2H2-type domain-containing protein n=1 Tax=Tetraparma gracilis TaxID=2962635 RepID=A0ABQ6MAF1_9STRA|nr:hypothetical protein TeGR_g874 [Tetraparma gracilis]
MKTQERREMEAALAVAARMEKLEQTKLNRAARANAVQNLLVDCGEKDHRGFACIFKTKDENVMRIHKATDHGIDVHILPMCPVPGCGERFSTGKSIKLHVKLKHPGHSHLIGGIEGGKRKGKMTAKEKQDAKNARRREKGKNDLQRECQEEGCDYRIQQNVSKEVAEKRMAIHRRLEHEGELLECPEEGCDWKTRRKLLMYEHEVLGCDAEEGGGERTEKCDDCAYTAIDGKGLELHGEEECLGNLGNGERKDSRKQFDSPALRNLHHKSAHCLSCKDCDAYFGTKDGLDAHRADVHFLDSAGRFLKGHPSLDSG